MFPIHVVIADDNSIFRKGLSGALNGEPQIVIVAQASNGKELIDVAEQVRIDVILLDIEMPLMGGIEAASIISKRFPDINIIALSMYDDEVLIKKMLGVGAQAYLLKNEDCDEIVRAIKTVCKSKSYFCNHTLLKVIERTSRELAANTHDSDFSNRELSVMKLICQEYSSKEIADKLNVSVRSIEHTKEKIQYKIGAKNMVGIALYAVKKMIITFKDLSDQNNSF